MDGLLTHFTKPLLAQTPRRFAVRFALIAGLLTLAACDAATPTPTRTPQPINTLEPAPAAVVATETVAVVVEVAATVVPPTVEPNDTGVSLTLPPSLAQSYAAQLETAIPRTEGPAFGGAAPAHVLITFDQQPIQFAGNPRERQIRVFPVDGLRGIDPFVSEEIDKLQALLEKKPANVEGEIPVLPMQYAAQVFHTQIQYLDFVNGSGVRFLSAYAQDITPITNENIFYTFQGLTSDGQYYISAFYPISSTALPTTYEESTAAQNMDEFAKTYTSKYLPGVAEGLNSLPPDQFIPDLSELDNLVQSLNAMPILPALPEAAVPTDTVSSASLVITATMVETPTEAVSMTVVTATESITAAVEAATAPVPVTATDVVSEATTAPTDVVTPTAESTATTSATPSATDAAAALQPAGEATVRALVNVRSLPTTQARVITQLSRNTKVQLLGRSPRSNWLYVLLDDGQRGWISVSFLQTTVPIRGLPVVS